MRKNVAFLWVFECEFGNIKKRLLINENNDDGINNKRYCFCIELVVMMRMLSEFCRHAIHVAIYDMEHASSKKYILREKENVFLACFADVV